MVEHASSGGKGSKVTSSTGTRSIGTTSQTTLRNRPSPLAVVEAFADVLSDPIERQQLKDAFQSEADANTFAEGMTSIIRSAVHKPIRPYEPPFGVEGADTAPFLGW